MNKKDKKMLESTWNVVRGKDEENNSWTGRKTKNDNRRKTNLDRHPYKEKKMAYDKAHVGGMEMNYL